MYADSALVSHSFLHTSFSSPKFLSSGAASATNFLGNIVSTGISGISSVKTGITSLIGGEQSDGLPDDFEVIDKVNEAFIWDIRPERGLDKQNYKCRSCARPIGVFLGEARVCDYDGQSYCSECHVHDRMLIPARIMHNWDFKRCRVSRRSKEILAALYDRPLVN